MEIGIMEKRERTYLNLIINKTKMGKQLVLVPKNNFEDLEKALEGAGEDAKKFYEKGNQAAGVRLRKKMQEIKVLAQLVREEVQVARSRGGKTNT